jgi:hypothetical protein
MPPRTFDLGGLSIFEMVFPNGRFHKKGDQQPRAPTKLDRGLPGEVGVEKAPSLTPTGRRRSRGLCGMLRGEEKPCAPLSYLTLTARKLFTRGTGQQYLIVHPGDFIPGLSSRFAFRCRETGQIYSSQGICW